MSHQTICHDMTCCYGWTTAWMLNSIKLKSFVQVNALFNNIISNFPIDEQMFVHADVIFQCAANSLAHICHFSIVIRVFVFSLSLRILIRSRLLSVHGYVVLGLRSNEACQIPYQFGTRVHSKFQNSPRCFQKDERGQGKSAIEAIEFGQRIDWRVRCYQWHLMRHPNRSTQEHGKREDVSSDVTDGSKTTASNRRLRILFLA